MTCCLFHLAVRTCRANATTACELEFAGRCRWTVGIGLEAFALSRVPEPLAANFRRGLIWGWGARASGLSHLTYETTRTFNLHSLDQPPFPCTVKLNRQARGVKRQALSRGGGRLGFEGGAVPMGAICGCFIRALKKLKQHGIGIGRQTHHVIGQHKLAHLGIERSLRRRNRIVPVARAARDKRSCRRTARCPERRARIRNC